MSMGRETGRSLGALAGLTIGFLIMWSAGFQGLWPAFWFGTGGAVAGGMSGERLVDLRRQRQLPAAGQKGDGRERPE